MGVAFFFGEQRMYPHLCGRMAPAILVVGAGGLAVLRNKGAPTLVVHLSSPSAEFGILQLSTVYTKGHTRLGVAFFFGEQRMYPHLCGRMAPAILVVGAGGLAVLRNKGAPTLVVHLSSPSAEFGILQISTVYTKGHTRLGVAFFCVDEQRTNTAKCERLSVDTCFCLWYSYQEIMAGGCCL